MSGTRYAAVPVAEAMRSVFLRNLCTELLVDDAAAAKKRGPAPKLQRQIERIQQLPRTQQ